MPYLTTADDTRLFYFDVGSGPAIVFSHAWALNSDQFHYLVNDLVDAGYRCIGLDRRGHGRSDRPGTGMTLDGFADDLALLLERLDVDNVTLAGHSLGCSEIVRYATRHGLARIARSLLLAPIMPLLVATDDNPDGVPRAYVESSAALLRRDAAEWCAQNAPPYFGVNPSVSVGLGDWTIRQILDTPVNTLVDTVWITTTTDLRAEVARFDVPTLVIHGTADASAPVELTGRKVAALLPRGTLVEIDGAGHGLYLNDVETIVKEFLAFAPPI
jgi:non-heme chloroperoxidase